LNWDAAGAIAEVIGAGAVGAHAVAYFFISVTKFEVTKGKPAEYASSEGVIRKFCSNCGTTLSWP